MHARCAGRFVKSSGGTPALCTIARRPSSPRCYLRGELKPLVCVSTRAVAVVGVVVDVCICDVVVRKSVCGSVEDEAQIRLVCVPRTQTYRRRPDLRAKTRKRSSRIFKTEQSRTGRRKSVPA